MGTGECLQVCVVLQYTATFVPPDAPRSGRGIAQGEHPWTGGDDESGDGDARHRAGDEAGTCAGAASRRTTTGSLDSALACLERAKVHVAKKQSALEATHQQSEEAKNKLPTAPNTLLEAEHRVQQVRAQAASKRQGARARRIGGAGGAQRGNIRTATDDADRQGPGRSATVGRKGIEVTAEDPCPR